MFQKLINLFKFNVNLGTSTKPRPLPQSDGTKLIYFKDLDPNKSGYTTQELNISLTKAQNYYSDLKRGL